MTQYSPTIIAAQPGYFVAVPYYEKDEIKLKLELLVAWAIFSSTNADGDNIIEVAPVSTGGLSRVSDPNDGNVWVAAGTGSRDWFIKSPDGRFFNMDETFSSHDEQAAIKHYNAERAWRRAMSQQYLDNLEQRSAESASLT